MSSTAAEPSPRVGSRSPIGDRPHRTYVGRTSQARVDRQQASQALSRVYGMSAADALTTLQFAAGSVCVEVARVVQQAVAQARHTSGIEDDELIVSGFEVGDGDAITRVRRLAHGRADWITTQTTFVQVELTEVRAQREATS